jgi:RHS repeat-associated protein
VDRAGRTTRFTYLPTRKLTSVLRSQTSGPTLTNSVAYDQQFNTLNITDAKGRKVERYKLDIQDRPVSVTNLEGQVMSVTYGVGSFVKSLTRFDGTAVTNTYNSDGLLSSVKFPGSTNSFTYLKNGLLKTAANGSSSISNTWDFANRLTFSASQVSGLSLQPSVSYSYFPAGQVSNVTSIAGTTTYALDNADRVSGIYGPTSSFHIAYDPYNGFMAAVTCTNTGLFATNSFDVMDRPTNIVWKKAATTLASFAYLYNNAGMVTQKIARVGNSTTTNRYVYNDLDWLTTETISGAATSSATFKYDLVGNWTNTVVSAVTNNYTYSNGCDRLVSWGKTNESKAWYNAAGCVTTLQYAATNKLFLTWDSEYRLTAVATGTVAAVVERNGYDALNRRAWSYGLDGTTTNFFVYSGADLIADLDRTGGLRRAYLYGPGIDNILAMTVYTGTTVKTYFYLKDMQGTVHGVTDSTGTNIVERYIFDAWGKVFGVYNSAGTKIAQSAIGNRFLWQGREYSWRTGLYFFRSRYYIASLGRWASKDAIGISGGLNLYLAFGNAPTVNVDPFGLVSVPGIEGGLMPGDVVLRATKDSPLRGVLNYTHTGIVGPDGRIYELSDGVTPGESVAAEVFFQSGTLGAVVRPALDAKTRRRAGLWAKNNIGRTPFDYASDARDRYTENCAEFAENAYVVGAGANPGLRTAQLPTLPTEYAKNPVALRQFQKYRARPIRSPDDWFGATGASIAVSTR